LLPTTHGSIFQSLPSFRRRNPRILIGRS
jgi:hypothetical protein